MKNCFLRLYRITLLCLGVIYGFHAESYVSKHVKNKDNKPFDKLCLCGLSNDAVTRIVGGRVAEVNEFPWQIGISDGYQRPFCGGALINDLFVLTAAHCFHWIEDANYMVLFGEHDVDDDIDMAFRVSAAEIIEHPKFSEVDMTYDIGLIKLQKRIPFSFITLPPCFPPPDIDYTGNLVTVTGWGDTNEDGSSSPVLREVEIPVISIEECRRKHKSNGFILDNNICTIWPLGGKDSCQGDSGGPLTWKHNGRWYLLGLVSFGDGCARPDSPSVYTRVDQYYRWIDEHTEGATVCND